MPKPAFGLKSWIWANNAKSTFLLLLFPFLLAMLFALGAYVFVWLQLPAPQGFYDTAALDGARVLTFRYGPGILAAALGWVVMATLFNGMMINAATGARGVSRVEEPGLYNLLENLCISRGLPMPRLQIVESEAFNAFASGLSRESYSITVTRGLMNTLTAGEMEGVLGHELTHIINRDVRLLVITTVFVGMISFLSQMAWRSLMNSPFGMPQGFSARGPYGEDRPQGRHTPVPLWLIAGVLLFVGYILALLLRFALSRRREYLADAGAVELTKNPQALANALRKISGHATLAHVPPEVKQMFIENSPGVFGALFGLFATHPPIEKRIAILEAMAGAPMPVQDQGGNPGQGSVPQASDL